MRRARLLAVITGTALAVSSFSAVRAQQAATRSVSDGVYQAEQAKRGAEAYAAMCAACHAENLTGDVGPALAGADFIAVWKDKTVGDLFDTLVTTMPLTAPGTLTPEQTADLTAFILSTNKCPAGTTGLAADVAPLRTIKFAEPAASGESPAAGAAGSGLYAMEQSQRGKEVYAAMCAACHAEQLTGDVGPALAGADFLAAWKDKTVGELFERVNTTMPLTSPGSMTLDQTADVVSFMLGANQFPAGASAMATDIAKLKAVPLGEPLQK
jgi:mono/diheme cytochrome c family protein